MGHSVLSIATEKGHTQVVLKNSQPSDGERPAPTKTGRAQTESGWAQTERSWHKPREAGTNGHKLQRTGRPYRDKNGFIGERGLEVATMVLGALRGDREALKLDWDDGHITDSFPKHH